MKVGFVGLGWQGGPIARRIVDGGFALTIWARRAASLDPFSETAATSVSTLEELGSRCDVVGICVVNDDDVMEVVVGGGLLAAMRPGGLLAVHSTVHPDTCRRLSALAAERDVSVVDAPVSGGAQAAQEGTLTVFVGATEEAFERYLPVLETFAGVIGRLGPVGAGQLAKLVNNVLFTAGLGIAREALALGDQLGLQRDALLEVLSAGSARSFALETLQDHSDPHRLAKGAGLLRKDLDLVRAIADAEPSRLGVLAPAAEHAIAEMRGSAD